MSCALCSEVNCCCHSLKQLNFYSHEINAASSLTLDRINHHKLVMNRLLTKFSNSTNYQNNVTTVNSLINKLNNMSVT